MSGLQIYPLQDRIVGRVLQLLNVALPICAGRPHAEQSGGSRFSGIVAMAVAERAEEDDDAADESSATRGLISGTEKAFRQLWSSACCECNLSISSSAELFLSLIIMQAVGDGEGSQADRFIRTGQETWLQNRWLDLAEVISDVGTIT